MRPVRPLFLMYARSWKVGASRSEFGDSIVVGPCLPSEDVSVKERNPSLRYEILNYLDMTSTVAANPHSKATAATCIASCVRRIVQVANWLFVFLF